MSSLRIGLFTGSIARIGSGRTEAVPLGRGLSTLGCTVFGIETSRLKRSRITVEGLEVHQAPLLGNLAPHLPALVRDRMRGSWSRSKSRELTAYERATGRAMGALAERLDLDVIYAFHNTNAAAVLNQWPHSRRILAMNLIGFGIDPGRGGADDTFPLQSLIFDHPYWDIHVTATHFEFNQYRHVYEQLGIDQRKLVQLPHCFDEEIFRPPDQPDPRESTHSLLYPVNVYPRKNIELAIEILSILRRDIDCALVVTGQIWDRDYHKRLLQLARDRRVAHKVSFLGGVPLRELVRVYQQSTVTIYTSHQETFGHGLTESLACGTPAVGPDWIVPCREILKGAVGGTAAPKDPTAFARAILGAIPAQQSSVVIAEHARRHYGNRAVAARFLELCQAIREGKQARTEELRSIDWKGLYQDAGDLF